MSVYHLITEGVGLTGGQYSLITDGFGALDVGGEGVLPSVGTNLHWYIKVMPNNNDDWETDSPFTTLLGSGKTGFALTPFVNTSETFNCTTLSSKLLEISDIDSAIKLFESTDKLTGLGGIAKTNDLVFVVENLSSTVEPLDIIGRVVRVILSFTSTPVNDDSASAKILFTGRVFDAKASFSEIRFTVRGKYQLWDKEIGELTNFESETYKSKIYPINYGDLSDEYAYIPAVLTSENIPKLYFDTQALKEISSMYFWGDDEKQAYTAAFSNDTTLSNDKTYLDFVSTQQTSVYLAANASYNSRTIYVWNPPTIIFEISGTPAVEPTEHSFNGVVATQGAIYHDGAGNYFEFLYKDGSFYVFTCWTAPSSQSGTLTRVQGLGSNLTFTWHSEKRDPEWVVEQTEEDDSSTEMSSAKAKELIIKIDNEYIQINKMTEIQATVFEPVYASTACEVDRALFGQGWDDHIAPNYIYLKEGATNNYKWLVKHTFWAIGNAGSHWANIDDLDHQGSNFIRDNFRRFLSTPGYTSGVPNFNYIPYLQTSLVRADEGGLYLMDLVFPPVSIDGEVSNIFVQGFYSVGAGALGGDDFSFISALIFGMGGKSIPVIDGITYPLAVKGSSTTFMNAVGFGKMTPPNSIAKYMNMDSTFQFLAIRGYDRNSDLDIPFTYYFDNVSSSPNQSETAYTLINTREDLKWDARVARVKDIESTRYYIGWLFYRVAATGSGTPNVTKSAYIAKPGLLVYFYVDPIKNALWVRGKGRVDLESNLIENPVDIISNVLTEEVGVDSSDLDTTTFTAAESDKSDWPLAFSIFGNPTKSNQVLEDVCKQSGLIMYELGNGKLALSSLDVPESNSGLSTLTNAMLLTDGNHNINYSEDFTSLNELVTSISAKYKVRYTDEEFMEIRNSSDLGAVSDLFTVTRNIIDEDRPATIELDKIRSQDVVDNLISLVATYKYRCRRILTVYTTLATNEWNIGKWIITSGASSLIRFSNNKVYLMIGKNIQLPFMGTYPEIKLTLLEFSLSDMGDTIIESGDRTDDIVESGSQTDQYIEGGYENV